MLQGKVIDSRTRLILAAEALFAKQGLEGTSAREIATLAGQKNNTAVQYHFGSKEALAREIIHYRMATMDGERMRMLLKASSENRLYSVRSMLEIICLPHLVIKDEEDRHPYAHFLSAYLPRYSPTGIMIDPETLPALPPALKELHAIGLKLFPDELQTVLYRRLTSVTGMFLNMVLALDSRDNIRLNGETFSDVLADTLDQMEAAMLVPPRHTRHTRPAGQQGVAESLA